MCTNCHEMCESTHTTTKKVKNFKFIQKFQRLKVPHFVRKGKHTTASRSANQKPFASV